MSQKLKQVEAYQEAEEVTLPLDLPTWQKMQYKAFHKWCNIQLRPRNMTIGSTLEGAFKDGYKLYHLLELLSKKSVPGKLAPPKSRIQMVGNLGLSFKFLQLEKIRLENIGVEDVVDEKLKLIMGLVWTLILRYQIQKSVTGAGGAGAGAGGADDSKGRRTGRGGAGDGGVKQFLLDWCKCIAHYRDVSVTNLTTSFQDGMAFNAMIHLHDPDLVDYSKLNKGDKVRNLNQAFDILEKEFGVHKIIDAKDMVEADPDEKTVIMYLSSCIVAFDEYVKKKKSGSSDTDPSQSVAYGPGTEIASTFEPSSFTIEARDRQGKKVAKGGDNFQVKLKGPDGQSIDVKTSDNQDGTYTVNYQSQRPGTHTLEVSLNGKPISNMPIFVMAEEDAEACKTAYYKWSTAYGPGTQVATTAAAGEFFIQAKNKYGNPVKAGGDKFVAKGKNPTGAAVPVDLHDNNDGTYKVTYKASVGGDHPFDVTLNNNSIQNCPFVVAVQEKALPEQEEADPKWSVAYGDGLKSAHTSKPSTFTIQAKNRLGENLKKGGSMFDVEITGPYKKPVPAKVTDNQDGTYTVNYQTKASGNHKVNVTLKAKTISNGIVSVPSAQDTDPAKSYAHGAGVVIASTAEPAEFVIQAVDTANNPVTRGGDPFRVQVTSSNGQTIRHTIKDKKNGTYVIRYQPTVAGTYTVNASLKGNALKGSPHKVTVEQNNAPNNNTDSKWSTLTGAGTELASTAETSEFTITAKNKYGNHLKRGGDAFKIAVKDERGLETPVFINNNKDGTYDVSYRAKFPGTHTLDVFLNGDDPVMKQQQVTVEQNSQFDDEFNARWSKAVGPGVEVADTNLESEFTIEGRNKYGNRISNNKTPGAIKVGVTDPNEATYSANSIENSGDGTFAVKYQTKAYGDHDVEVTVDGDHLYNSPFTVGSVQVTDPTSCTVSGGGSQSAMINHPAEFVITARDVNKNAVTRGGDDFQVRVIAPNGDLLPVTLKDNGNGTYDVSYKATTPGHHQLDISLNGVQVAGKPLSVLVEEDPKELAKADPQFTTLYGPQLSSTQEPVVLKIQAKNKYGTNLTEGGAEFTVNLNVPKGSAAITPEVVDNKDGTYTCTFQPKAPGQHVVDVMLEGTSVNNSPLTLLVTNPTNINEEPSAKTTNAFGPGLEKADTAEKATFTVQARNQFGNALKKGGHQITVDIKEPSRSSPVHADVKDNDDGTYTVSYQPSLAGKHEISVALDGKTIGSGKPHVVYATQTLDPSKCTVSGAGVKIASTAEPSEFVIQARDSQGNKILRGGADFKPKVTTASGETIKAHIRDNADGTYTATYQPTTPGTYTIEVTSDNKHVAGSPFKPTVEQNNEVNKDLSPTWTVATGAGTELASDYEVSELKVQAKNKYGNNLARGGDKLKVDVKSPNNDSLPVNVIDNGDGSYSVSYNPLLPGDHQLSVALNGQPISENKEPAKVSVDHRTEYDETMDPRWSTAVGPGASTATTAGKADFLVQARNKYGNKVHRGGAPLKAEAKNTRGLVIGSGVQDNNNGTYTVNYQPTESGLHHVSLKVDQQPLYRTPLEIDVTQGVDPSKCTVFGAGSSVASTAEPAEFYIQAVDLAGNKVTRGGDKFLVRIQSPAGSEPVVALVVDKKNGTYLVRYHPTSPGQHTINIVHAGSGKTIAASPLKVNVDQQSAPDQSFEPKWSNSLGAGIDIGSTAEKAELKLQARNKYGNKLKKGGADVKAEVSSPSGSPLNLTVHDDNDGTYTLSYQPTEEGEHKLKLSANGNCILNDTHHLPVDQNKAAAEDADPKYSTASGAGVESATTSEPAVFTVQAKNKYGNKVAKPGDAIKLNVKSPSGSSKPVKTGVKDNGDGSYTVTYQPVAAGDHVLDVTMNGVSIFDSPFVVPVTQETDPSKCKAAGAGTEIASTAEPASFTIHAYDKAGNHVTRGGDPFQVDIKDPSGAALKYKIKDNYDGTYQVTYQPEKPGVHTLDASLKGVSITGGKPFKVNVEHNDKPNQDIDGKWSVMDGAGGEIGSTAEKAEFDIQAKNKYGNDLRSGGHPFSTSVRAPGGAELPVKVIDNGDGSYKISYNPTIPGEYDVGVKLGAKDITHLSPVVELNDRPSDEADPKWSVVTGPGVTKASISEPADCTLIAKNKYGNQLKRGGDQADVQVHGPDKSSISSSAVDNGDGSYSITYKPSALGEHTVDVFLNGHRVHKSPFHVPVTSGADASKSEVYGDGIETANVGEPAKFFIQAKDKNWSVVRSGGDNFQVAITDPSGTAVPANVQDNGDGSYTVTYTPLHAGDHAVSVSLDREPVTSATVVAKQTTDVSKTEIKDLPTDAQTFETVSFIVETKDKSGAKLNAGGDDVYAKITPPAGSRAVIAHVVDLGNGDYRVSFVPQVPGAHSVAVSVNQNNVPNSPVSIPVKQSPADASSCVLEGPGFTDASTSNPAVFKLISKDKKGNLLPTGGEPFKATAVNGANNKSVPVDIKDNGDGTYGVSFKAPEPGTYQLSVTLRDQPINGSSFAIPVKQIVDPSKCSISGEGVTGGVTSQPSTFNIQAMDEAGGEIRGGGQSFMVKILDPNGAPIPAIIRDNKDGSYSVTYNPYAPGVHTVEVKLDGKPVGDGPFKPDIKAGKATTMSEFETSLWKEMNKARVTPQLYAQSMRELLPNYEGLKYKIPGSKYARMTKEGPAALEEAIKFLENGEPSPALELSEEFSRSCFDLCDDQGPSGGVGTVLSDGTPADQRLVRYGAWKKKVTEIINYGGLTPQDIVQQWLIDDGVSDRSNRRDVCDPVFKTVGISSGPHAKAMRMTVVSLAGGYVPGDYGEGRTKDRKVHSSRDEFSIERYATPDGKGYLIEGGDVGAKKENLKLMKEGTFLHLYRTLYDEDGEAVVSHFRWQIPFDFDPITATGLLKPNAQFFISLRRPTTLDPNVPHEVTRFTTVAKSDADDEILSLKMKQNNTHILIDIAPGTIGEDVQVTIQNNILGLNCDREVIGEDEEGEYKQKLTEERSVKLPFPVGLSSFSLEPKEDNTFILKIAKPQTKPDQQNVEIPILNF